MNFWEYADRNGLGLFFVAAMFIVATAVVAIAAIERGFR